MKTHAVGTQKNIVTQDGECALLVRGSAVVGRMGPRTCLQGAADCEVLVGMKDELDAEVANRGLNTTALAALPSPEPLENQVQRALAQRDEIDAFLARPEIAPVVEQVQAAVQAARKLQPAGGLQAEHG